MKEYLWLCRGKEVPVTQQTIKLALEKKGIRAACLWEQDESRELGMEELLLDERIVANGILLEKELLSEAGGKNTRLPAKREYELALRVAEHETVYLLPASFLAGETEKAGAGDVENGVQEIWCEFCTDAYIAGRYREFLQERGLFEAVVEAVLTEGLAVESAPKVEAFLQQMIARTEAYFYYYDATQPILIYLGDSCCYNILNVLANELAKALHAKGNAIRFYDVAAEDVQGLSRLLGERYKASIGFQAWIFSIQRKDGESYFQDLIGGPKYNFVLDHPIWMQKQLQCAPKRYYILTHDRNYQAFIRKYDKGVADAYLLPPGGRRMAESCDDGERIYDVAFLGTYTDYRNKLAAIMSSAWEIKFMAARFLFVMRKNPDITAELAFQKTLDHYKITLDQETFLERFGEFKEVIQCIMFYYREKVVETILQAGITLHVFGDTWKNSPFAQNPLLCMHEAVFGDEAAAVLQKTKLSLNVMAWHKDGFTERIADSMLAGAVVVSDNSSHLEEFYRDETVRFELRELEKLPGLLNGLLADEKKRLEIAKAAKNKASAMASWEVRAEQLLQIIEEESTNR